jgi:hypothetical protein
VIRACLALLALPLATPAWAELPSVSITNTLTVEGHADNGNASTDDDGYFIILDRLNLQAGTELLDVGVRLDAVGFSDTAEGKKRVAANIAKSARKERKGERRSRGSTPDKPKDNKRSQMAAGKKIAAKKPVIKRAVTGKAPAKRAPAKKPVGKK